MIFLKPCNGPITSLYGPRLHPVTGKAGVMHWGVDYGNTPGNNDILAAEDGVIGRARNAETDGYGKYVRIVHSIGGKHYETLYAHLSSISVKEGQKVKRGQKIGVKGNTGIGTGVHLHFEVHIGPWNNKFTNSKNPLFYVNDPGVTDLQKKLVALGYKTSVDGTYGDGLRAAVQQFQKAFKLDIDGVAGGGTMAVIDREFAKVKNNPVKETPEKEELKKEEELAGMFKGSTGTINQAVIAYVKGALEDGSINDKSWLEKAEKGELSGFDLLGLNIIINEARRGKFRPTTSTLRASLVTFVEGAIEDGLLTSSDWLEKAKNDEFKDDDVAAIHMEIANRMREKKK